MIQRPQSPEAVAVGPFAITLWSSVSVGSEKNYGKRPGCVYREKMRFGFALPHLHHTVDDGAHHCQRPIWGWGGISLFHRRGERFSNLPSKQHCCRETTFSRWKSRMSRRVARIIRDCHQDQHFVCADLGSVLLLPPLPLSPGPNKSAGQHRPTDTTPGCVLERMLQEG